MHETVTKAPFLVLLFQVKTCVNTELATYYILENGVKVEIQDDYVSGLVTRPVLKVLCTIHHRQTVYKKRSDIQEQ